MSNTPTPFAPPQLNHSADGARLALSGAWVNEHFDAMQALTQQPIAPQAGPVDVDASALTRLDTSGVLQCEQLLKRLQQAGFTPKISGLDPAYAPLFDDVRRALKETPAQIPAPKRTWIGRVDALGAAVLSLGQELLALINLWGNVVLILFAILTGRTKARPLSLIAQLEQVAYSATGIIILITFLIGAIIGQQGIFHFRQFGADTYVVDMVGILTLREIGVLIVAIMVAGRTGSAYTAELGSMKMREEIDALKVMGLDPIAVLVLPRLLALMIGLPLLTIIGNFSALVGGALVADLYGGLPLSIFIQRFEQAVSLKHLWVGLTKAPFMALIIALVACLEGLKVEGSSESLGRHTTASVVKAIFLVIVLDGIFAIVFAAMGV